VTVISVPFTEITALPGAGADEPPLPAGAEAVPPPLEPAEGDGDGDEDADCEVEAVTWVTGVGDGDGSGAAAARGASATRATKTRARTVRTAPAARRGEGVRGGTGRIDARADDRRSMALPVSCDTPADGHVSADDPGPFLCSTR
jgi:hypothetical protein